ncbi:MULTISPECIES: MOSC domain-containing protein [unclassified Aureispira]|uniref:MOSC domain-containing protein n=1 Tax=unclassified Aureispira TaxID=2649989 RepID=UPI000696BEA4|nr:MULTISPECIES: MOSC domain-containing protein [unclassified Aureispira]WMX12690.1 MOSC domain-containing protein [Aureispira sp. CCB-E]
MKLISLNVGQPQTLTWKGKTVQTSIFKQPIHGKQSVSFLNIVGDQQADLRYHGGRDKAIYSYDLSHYEAWKKQLHRDEWSFGLFGENLSTEGLDETQVLIGNIYQIGSVVIQATQPRIPCFKLNICFDREDMTSLFYNFKRYGIYFRVLEEGTLEAGDTIKLIESSPYAISIQDLVNTFVSKGKDKVLLEKILDIPLLPNGIRKNFLSFL